MKKLIGALFLLVLSAGSAFGMEKDNDDKQNSMVNRLVKRKLGRSEEPKKSQSREFSEIIEGKKTLSRSDRRCKNASFLGKENTSTLLNHKVYCVVCNTEIDTKEATFDDFGNGKYGCGNAVCSKYKQFGIEKNKEISVFELESCCNKCGKQVFATAYDADEKKICNDCVESLSSKMQSKYKKQLSSDAHQNYLSQKYSHPNRLKNGQIYVPKDSCKVGEYVHNNGIDDKVLYESDFSAHYCLGRF